ncbi:MAG: aspartate--tRNA(Asn) ligase [Promethearchaeota archaeon]
MQLDKLENWRRTHHSDQIELETLEEKEITVCGWIKQIRDLGGLKFVILRDNFGEIQVTFPKVKIEPALFEKTNFLKNEMPIAVNGIVKEDKRSPTGFELIPTDFKILNDVTANLPLDPTYKVKADLDTRLDNRILDLRSSQSHAIFIIHHRVATAMRQFFVERRFIEINTPRIIATATEGGTELFPIAYFEKEAFLAQSPQLYKEQLITVFDKVYEIAPIFRAEEHSTTRHLNELMMVDIEMAFADYIDVMNVLEELIHYVISDIKINCGKELNTLNIDLSIPELPFPRYTYTETLDLLAKNDYELTWGDDIGTDASRKLGSIIDGPFFITEWPSEGKPFYIQPRDDKPEISESFDLMYGMIELASGGTRIHEKETLIQRLSNQGLSPNSFAFHLKVFDWGMPPHAGWGLGLARLVMILTGRQNIREVVLFPRDRTRLTP